MFGLFNRNPKDGSASVQSAQAQVETRDADNDPWAWAEGLIAPASGCGEEVSPQRALESAAVRNACDILAGLIGTLPLAIYKPSIAGGAEAVDSHPALALVRTPQIPGRALANFARP